MVDDVNSAICIGYLEVMECETVVAESVLGPCAAGDLQK